MIYKITSRDCTRFGIDLVPLITNQLICKALSTSAICGTQHQIIAEYLDTKTPYRTDDEWLQAKPYSSLPGPSKLGMLRKFLPGGSLHNSNLVDMHRLLRSEYGDIHLIKGTFGKLDLVSTYNPKDFEIVYRNEGPWPLRVGLDTFTYYRKVKRPDIFQNLGGLITEQGKTWADMRNKVNPILMKLQNVRQNVPQIDEISLEFMAKFKILLDPTTHQLNSNFFDELKLWAFEAVSLIALNTRMGLMSGKPDANVLKLVKCMDDFFQYTYEYDIVPSFWKYYETAGFKHLLQTFDDITDITTSYIEKAIKKFEEENNKNAKSVLEKLCRLDKQVAIVMAIDMLMAGIDTSSSAFITILYHIARNPEKQKLLHKELKTILPHKDAPLTEANTKNMPYLRACMKEAMRFTHITPSNFRITVKDLVLSGYQVPKGTGVLMGVMALSNCESYFPNSTKFLPERWLKSGENACPAAKHSNPFVYMPFGFGPRTCIGKRIAEMEIETLLARLLRNYEVSWVGDKELQYISNIILLPHGNISFQFKPIHE